MKASKELPSELEWNFDQVPDDELVACCYWEYARESAFIRDRLLAYRRRPSCSGGEYNEEIRTLWNDIEAIHSIGYAADVFVRGCTFEPEKVWQTSDPDKPNYRHPDAPPLTGSFPAPWQSLSTDERKFRSHISNNVEHLRIEPVKLSHWSWAKEIARECQQNSDEQYERRKDWERRYLRRDAAGNFFTTTDAPEPPTGDLIWPRVRWGVGETLVLDIAWESFTNDEIASYFRKWLQSARPRQIPIPDGKGRNKARDWRANLTRLAVTRLLGRFTALEIVDDAEKKCSAVFESKQFSARKWADVTKWYDARREAGKLFRNLFPFLPVDEKPLSWNRSSPDQ